jgi:hypothetical protein
MVGISSNDVVTQRRTDPIRWSPRPTATLILPYDETQEVAAPSPRRAPPTFVSTATVGCRGQLTDLPQAPVTAADVRAAVDAVLSGRPVDTDQRPSNGCGIKWR